MSKETPSPLNGQVFDRKLSRRKFLKIGAATGGALLLSQFVGTDQKEIHAQSQTNEELAITSNQSPRTEGLTATQQSIGPREPSLLGTAVEAAIFTTGNVAIYTVAETIGLPVTHGSEKTSK